VPVQGHRKPADCLLSSLLIVFARKEDFKEKLEKWYCWTDISKNFLLGVVNNHLNATA